MLLLSNYIFAHVKPSYGHTTQSRYFYDYMASFVVCNFHIKEQRERFHFVF